MIRRIANFLIGNDLDCSRYQGKYPTIHANKFPCYYDRMGQLAKDHPHYFYYEQGENLYLNMIDPPVPMFAIEVFQKAIGFIETRMDKEILVHCNMGASRSPSIVMVALARKGLIPKESYEEARKVFKNVDLDYWPGKGIQTYLAQHWTELMDPSFGSLGRDAGPTGNDPSPFLATT